MASVLNEDQEGGRADMDWDLAWVEDIWDE
jgi:hypothetical protein